MNFYLKVLFVVIAFFNVSILSGQIEISEISNDGTVELVNTSGSTVDVSNYWLCNRPAYTRMSNLTLECGQLNLAAGESVTVSGFRLNGSGDELGFYSNSSFGSTSGLVDYVIWGNRQGGTRETVAVAAGLWSSGDRAAAIPNAQSLNKDLNGQGVGAYAVGQSSICDDGGNTGGDTCEVDSGTIALSGGGDRTTICVDGNPDPLNVSFTQQANGSSVGYIITDDANNILALPAQPPFDLDGAGIGTCLIWAVAYEPGFSGAEVGNNISDLEGCYDLSNSLLVYRESPDGGNVSLLDGSTNYAQCAGQITFDVTHTNTAPNLSYWYIITDDNDNILDWVNSANSNTLDLSNAPAGTCRVWGWSYRGLGDPIRGQSISTLTDDDCEAISDNFITVYREVPDGGTVSLLDGSTNYAQCAGQITFDVMHTTTAPNLSYWYIITDDNDDIIAWVNSANSNTLDLSGAPAGTCRVWGWNYRGLGDPVVGQSINTLKDDFCEDISDNFITVYREVPDGGTVSLLDGSTSYTGTAGDIVFDVTHTTTAPFLSYWYIITDDNDNILDWVNSANSNTLDLSGAPAGICRVWGWNYRGLGDPVVGESISTLTDDFCEAISDNFITVTRNADNNDECNVDGGVITFDDGRTRTSICVDGNADPLDVVFTSAANGGRSGYIITDDNNNILALPSSGPFDLDGAGVGTCLIWSISYDPGFGGAEVGNSLSNLTGCYDLSEPLTVYREAPDGGMVSLLDGSTNYAQCAGQIVFDVTHTTTAPNLSYWYIITDDNNDILAWVNSANSNTLDLSGAPAGTCRVWGWNYRGLGDPVVGESINTLADDDCEDISDNYITVYREVPDGGTVSLLDGSTSYTGTAGDIVFDVTHTTTAPFLSYWYIITDDNDYILDWVNAANSNTLDLSGAPAGTCRVWGWNYRGLGDPVRGESIATLMDDFCEDISTNYVEVIRLAGGVCDVEAGSLALGDGSTSIQLCAADGQPDILKFRPRNVRGDYRLVVTNSNDDIIALPTSNTIDADGMNAGEYRVFVLAYQNVTGVAVGNNLSEIEGCFDLSNGFILDRIICDPGCQVPLNLRVQELSSGRFLVSWNGSSDARGYEILLGFEGSNRRFRVLVQGTRIIVSTRSSKTIALKVRTICGSNSFSAFSDYINFQGRGRKSIAGGEPTGDVYGEFTIDEPNLSVYPNPTADFINVKFENNDTERLLQIVDVRGSIIHSSIISEGRVNERVNVDHLNQGIYQVSITTDGQVLDQTRFIKM